MKKILEVVAALIWQDDKFLICQRPEGKDLALHWEFVGGKVESGESLEAALTRECLEELGIILQIGEIFGEVTYTYPHAVVHLTLLNASIKEGKPTLLEHKDMAWIGKDDIPNYTFCPADVTFLEELRSNPSFT
ncbi:MAG: (deoxy)nucleoside triphosphate pyrophosphohydrolase [Eubacteriales bacterium]